jgi:hypothetical protein
VLTSTHQPRRHGVLIDAEGSDNGLERTAVTPQGEDHGDHVRCGPQPVEGRARGGRKGMATPRAPRALLHVTMHPKVPLTPLPSSRAVQVVAAWRGRVHRWPPLDAIVP